MHTLGSKFAHISGYTLNKRLRESNKVDESANNRYALLSHGVHVSHPPMSITKKEVYVFRKVK